MSETVMNEIEILKTIFMHDWTSLAYDGCKVDGFITVDRVEGDDGRWTRNIEVITRGPSGQHYRWEYKEGLTEEQESFGPSEYVAPKIVPVRKIEKTIIVTEWVE